MAARAGDAGQLRREVSLSDALAERLRVSCLQGSAAAISRYRLHLSPRQLLAGLPALGDVLFQSGHASGALLDELPAGVLLESICLAPLLQCCSLLAACVITVDGPREWIECQDAAGLTHARVYLLPDTDYLAWDMLCARASPLPSGVPAAATRRPAYANLLHFHTRTLAGLQVLGAATSGALSPLSRQLAARIAQDEAIPFTPAALG